MVVPPKTHAQSVLNLPVPGTMVSLSPSYIPAIMTGLTIYPENPLQFDFIIDIGDDKLHGEALRKDSEKLISYFMAALTIPADDMWVNLSPYEKDRIIAEGLGNTIMGRDMLAQDYILKQLTASLMYPEEDIGNEFWQRVYTKVQERFGTNEIPANIPTPSGGRNPDFNNILENVGTFNKIWIIPERAVVYVNGHKIFVAESHLRVMLEEDYILTQDARRETIDDKNTSHISRLT